MVYYLAIALDLPIPELFDYSHKSNLAVGTRVLVSFGNRQLIGMVWAQRATPKIAANRVKPIDQVLDDLDAMPADWLRMAQFAADYYHHPVGQIAIPALPGPLRKASAYNGKRAAGGPVKRADKRPKLSKNQTQTNYQVNKPVLNQQQQYVLEQLSKLFNQPATALLHGVTGSGKTEIYLNLAQQALDQNKQVLILVPEINLTPQLEQIVAARLCATDNERLAVLHSRLSQGDRLRMWLRVLRGHARILLGTRLSLFTPMPDLGLIIVDEEHDISYKQQEGLRYSARDLAIWRGHDLSIPVILGSATPSIETWHKTQSNAYQLYSLPERAQAQPLPEVQLVNTNNTFLENGFSDELLQAIAENLERKQQSLIFINRRGYAPVLRCVSCSWLSQCRFCSTHTVLHKSSGQRHFLQCHHCGMVEHVPIACPNCGNTDLQAIGQGTQRIEDFLQEQFPQANILRIDADSTRKKGSAQALFEQVHSGQADILVGTQMIAKGHDFAGLTLVGILNGDAALFSHDYRAPERLFAQLMQVTGRAGRRSDKAQVLVQTDFPDQAVYQALLQHDYINFADVCLSERQALNLPPYTKQALFTAQASKLQTAIDFLNDIKLIGSKLADYYQVRQYDAVPLHIYRVAKVERAQLLIEANNRVNLHKYLQQLLPYVWQIKKTANLRWDIEIDPAYI